MKRADRIIAETLGWDVSEIKDYRYQRYVNPVVYAIGDQYFAAHKIKPKHDVGQEWVEHTDQFGARDTDRKVWVCQTQG